MSMKKDSAQVIQAMPLLEGKVNLVSGTHEVKNLFHCAEAGTVTITWPTGTTADIPMVAGQEFTFTGELTITPVTGGTYHID